MRSPSPDIRHAPALTVRLSVAAMLVVQTLPGHAALPSQSPLLNRALVAPAPNVMLTVDDSGSMTYQYLPERTFKLNGYTVVFPEDKRVYVHPKELGRNIFLFGDYTRFLTAAQESEFVGDREGNMRLTQAQMRSPQVNTLYYNPYLRYKPWRTADNQPYLDADPENAWLHPSYLQPNASRPNDTSLYVNLTVESTHDVRWFCRDNGDWEKCEGLNEAKTSLTYSPALVYMLRKDADPNQFASYQLYNLNAADSFDWPEEEAKDRDDCELVGNMRRCSQKQERQNFANWFVYHRSRLFVAQGAMPEALRNSVDEIRLGWGTIHPRQLFDQAGNERWTTFDPDADISGSENAIAPSHSVQQGVRPLTQQHLAKFTDWLRRLGTHRYTPTLHAVYSVGEYFKRTGSLNPWQNDMSRRTDPSAPLSCRRAYNVLMTDGYYQSDATLNSSGWTNMFALAGLTLPPVGNADANAVQDKAFPTMSDPRIARAYSDSLSNTLADYAMSLWFTDLQADIPDNVKPIDLKTKPDDSSIPDPVKEAQSDPATWQHLTHLTIGFGVTGTLPDRDKNGTIGDLISGSKVWPSPVNEIDDLWHAAVNSRGRYFSASNSSEFKNSLEGALDGTKPIDQTDGGLATASSVLTPDNFKYVPQYSSKDWSGDLVAYKLDQTGKASTQPFWQASKVLREPDDRRIFIWQGDRKAIPFKEPADLDAATRRSVPTKALINFIRGGDGDDTMRKRTASRLPDFINSMPLFLKEGTNFGYSNDNYNDFMTDKAKRTGRLFVGGNGGMLHVFNAENGVEEFAFIPKAVAPKLSLIADQSYGLPGVSHQYAVDGQLTESDVRFPFGGKSEAWHNIVVGTLGAGGKSVFALRVPLTGQINGTDVLWEVEHEDMGYITTIPQVGRTPNGDWKIFVGNGANSSSGRTALLVIDAASGAITSIPVGSTDGTDSPHGMGGVALAYDKVTGNVVAAYAGDSRGRLWRFDVTSSGVVPGYGGSPLFTATDPDGGNPQPITAAPLVAPHPRGGQMIVLNTGRVLYDTDLSDRQVQSVYGVWDKTAAATRSAGQPVPSLTRTNLARQSITGSVKIEQKDTGKPATFYNISSTPVDWSTQRGWLLDLKFTDGSEKEVRPKGLYEPLRFGDSVLISAARTADAEPSCDASTSQGYGFVVKALTGSAPTYPALDADHDGKISDNEALSSGFEYSNGRVRLLSQPPNKEDLSEEKPTDKRECIRVNRQDADQPDGTLMQDCKNQFPPGEEGKPIKDRIWRQLLNPPVPTP